LPTLENKKAKLEHHLSRCMLKHGDRVCFKKPKKKRVYGTVLNIERDIDKVTWTKGGLLPFYISVELEIRGKDNDIQIVKTYESKLRFIGAKK
jgi:hypothetical protein